MNKYTSFALTMIAVILIMTIFNVDDDETKIIGYADDHHQSENGTTFTINDAAGNSIKAFSRIEIDDSLHVFRGEYSQDGEMFFVNAID